MKSHLDPEIWATDWRAWCDARENALDTGPETNESAGDDPSRWHTVSAGGGRIAAHLLKQLKNSTAPTLDQSGEDRENGDEGSALLVSAVPANAPWRKAPAGESAAGVEPGSMLHLHPDLDSGWIFPVHVAVIDRDDASGRVLLAPFSPLSIPSCEGELATGIDDASLAVICLWNARWADEAKTRRSWPVDSLAPELLAEVKQLQSALGEGKGVPSSLADRVGTPVIHPEDPRQDYLDEMEDLLGAIGAPD